MMAQIVTVAWPHAISGIATVMTLRRVIIRGALVARTGCDPNRATQYRAQSVAADSRSLRDVAGMSRYTPPKDRFAPVFPPPCRIYAQSVLERQE